MLLEIEANPSFFWLQDQYKYDESRNGSGQSMFPFIQINVCWELNQPSTVRTRADSTATPGALFRKGKDTVESELAPLTRIIAGTSAKDLAKDFMINRRHSRRLGKLREDQLECMHTRDNRLETASSSHDCGNKYHFIVKCQSMRSKRPHVKPTTTVAVRFCIYLKLPHNESLCEIRISLR
jgi:hypothetical protein